ncbi:methyltransferase domain-containing protein [Arachnia propionica]|uniref:Methyltransferase domain-containing protein n=1 Tax=Arachnia propionica TaxID=1750 RepID=A0A3P1T7C4_9ACTN|nr:class I SAM-dependent methyltransferase [Arachnia propionica]RRD05407.1 methyltransferase domain-containing protein [Arachnia propionica]
MTTCRLCGARALMSVLDLGASPPCESFLTKEQLDLPEVTYPLHLRLCRECLLLQIPALITPQETFGGDYAYLSSFSTSWVEHARRFVDQAIVRLGLSPDDLVVEVAANDGYLLQHVVAAGIRCLGIEPSVNCSEAARAKGVPMLRAFLDEEVAARVRAENGPARLVVANNVWAHIPDIIGFTRGLAGLVDRDGWVSIEVHHALSLITLAQFDTIYHEHFQYWSVLAAGRGLAAGGLRLVDVELLPTHGGSIRLWAVREDSPHQELPSVAEVVAMERDAGLDRPEGYLGLAERVARIRDDLVAHLVEARRQGRRVVAYGMPGKGNTLLNYCGIRPDLLAYGADMNTFKHGRYAPGSRIPVVPPEHLVEDAPDDVVVLPWNLRQEITAQLSATLRPGTRLVFPVPHLEVEEVAPR